MTTGAEGGWDPCGWWDERCDGCSDLAVEPVDAMVPTPLGDSAGEGGATVGHTTWRAVRRDDRNPEGPAEQVRAGSRHRADPARPDALHFHPLPRGLRLHREHARAGWRPAGRPG